MSWIVLIVAGVFEMLGVVMIGQVHKRRSWVSLALLIACFGLSFLLLAVAMKTLPMGVAYAVWTGIGASGGSVLGMLWFGEPRNGLRIVCIAAVLGATIGLKLLS